jgi:hypothetical protein
MIRSALTRNILEKFMKYMHDIVLEHSCAMLKVNEIIIIFVWLVI